MTIRTDLKEHNRSAMDSLEEGQGEGLEETLALHRLGVFSIIGKSFKMTNCTEVHQLDGRTLVSKDRLLEKGESESPLAGRRVERYRTPFGKGARI